MSATTAPPAANGSAALATRQDVRMGDRGLALTGINDMWRFAGMVASTPGLAPKGMEKPEAICVAIQLGAELGLSPMQACQSIAVINGRPSIFGDAAKALVEGSGLCERYEQWFELDGKKLVTAEGHARTPYTAELTDKLVACVLSRRKGRAEFVTTFSVEDAKRAGLWGKAGPWQQYPARMLTFRARGFNLRDNFGDVLKGLYTAEEAGDLPAAGPTSTERLHAKLQAAVPAPAADPAEVIEGVSEPAPAAEHQPPAASDPPKPKRGKKAEQQPPADPADDGDPQLDGWQKVMGEQGLPD